jgi:hypothetical protein
MSSPTLFQDVPAPTSDLPAAARTGQAAIDYTNSRVGGTMPDSGLCLQFVRQNYAVPSFYYSAIDAWNAAVDKHPNDRNPPPGTPVYFWTPSQYRHVAFHTGDGRVVSTFNADIRSFPSLAAVESSFGGPYMGWAQDLNRQLVWWNPDEPEIPLEEDVKPWFIRRNDGLIVIVSPTGVRGIDAAAWGTYTNLGLATFQAGFENMDPGPFDSIVNSLGGIVG